MRLAPSPKRQPACLILTALILVFGLYQGDAADAAKSPPHSFVRGAAARKLVKGFPNNVMPIVIVDDELPGILDDFPGYTVDVVMQQCHSGGFGPVLTNLPVAVEWTFASSVQLKETSVRLDIMYPGWVGYLDNFTRAWYEDAVLYPATGPGNGMKQHYETAISGRPAQANPAISAIPPDLYAPPPRTARELAYRGAGRTAGRAFFRALCSDIFGFGEVRGSQAGVLIDLS